MSMTAACAGISQDDAKSLATAGQAATQAVQDQATAIQSSLNYLPTTIAVDAIMKCKVVTNAAARQACISGAPANSLTPPFETARKQLVAIAAQRAQAMNALEQAYKAFGDLASYDAGQATANAITTAFKSINTLSKSLSALGPEGAAIPVISATITDAVAGAGGFIAQQRQSKLMLAASKDLHTATDAMIKALSAEQDEAAMKSLIQELEKERDRLELSTLDAGLVSPTALMSSFYAKVAPDITLIQNPNQTNTDLADASAHYVLKSTVSERAATIADSYTKSIDTLSAVSAQHTSLENKQKVDVSWIITEAQYLENLVNNLGK
jgi:hypothetical protein